ncbi:MAG: hypothetical protein ACR2ND_03535 [Solirubrobacteraceae bacterium]
MRLVAVFSVVAVLCSGVCAAQANLAHVLHTATGATIVDGRGRQLLLRGVNVDALVEYNGDCQGAVPLGGGDFREMAALGIKFRTVGGLLERIEPAPSRVSTAYLNEIAR